MRCLMLWVRRNRWSDSSSSIHTKIRFRKAHITSGYSGLKMRPLLLPLSFPILIVIGLYVFSAKIPQTRRRDEINLEHPQYLAPVSHGSFRSSVASFLCSGVQASISLMNLRNKMLFSPSSAVREFSREISGMGISAARFQWPIMLL